MIAQPVLAVQQGPFHMQTVPTPNVQVYTAGYAHPQNLADHQLPDLQATVAPHKPPPRGPTSTKQTPGVIKSKKLPATVTSQAQLPESDSRNAQIAKAMHKRNGHTYSPRYSPTYSPECSPAIKSKIKQRKLSLNRHRGTTKVASKPRAITKNTPPSSPPEKKSSTGTVVQHAEKSVAEKHQVPATATPLKARCTQSIAALEATQDVPFNSAPTQVAPDSTFMGNIGKIEFKPYTQSVISLATESGIGLSPILASENAMRKPLTDESDSSDSGWMPVRPTISPSASMASDDLWQSQKAFYIAHSPNTSADTVLVPDSPDNNNLQTSKKTGELLQHM